MEERHFYELVPEGSPCKLYFDIEYSIPANVEIDGEHVLSAFKKV